MRWRFYPRFSWCEFHELPFDRESVVLTVVSNSRWMRLLFGREFAFEDVLVMWDHLFAEGLRPELVDFVCVAMLLRIRWTCMFLILSFD